MNKKIYKVIKRIFDILFSLIGLIGMLLVYLGILVSRIFTKEKGPVFYTQKRVGKDKKVFKLYKFRSMVVNADEVLEELKRDEKYGDEWMLYQKITKDPRITKTGYFLRKYSLDELPQFINILIGDMSLIGPRPLLVNELEEHGGDPDVYYCVKPGLTSWWACNGRSSLLYEERLELEYYYINNFSFAMDVKTFFKTIETVLLKKDGV